MRLAHLPVAMTHRAGEVIRLSPQRSRPPIEAIFSDAQRNPIIAPHTEDIQSYVRSIVILVSVLPIRIFGDPVLHIPTRSVPIDDDGSIPSQISTLVIDMFDTLAASKGVALAANQVGADLRLFVYDCPEMRGESTRRRGVLINPVLQVGDVSDRPPHPEDDLEGCLSLPGLTFPTGRAGWARVTGVDVGGEPVVVEGTGLIARMLQHETAHLDGATYIQQLVAPYAQQAEAAVEANGWGGPGLSWVPGQDPNPFEA
jgi:peptide deformylase